MAAGGMRATGSWGSLSERVHPSKPTAAPEPPDSMQHCWVNGEHGRLPGLLLSWQRRPESEWLGRVVRPVVVDGEWVIVEEWLPAAMLEPAKSTAGRR